MRDIDKDRALCATATPAKEFPRNKNLKYLIVDESDGFYCALTKQETDFLTEARTALPYWIDQYEEASKERDAYRQEAMNERELSASIVGEREELIIENERLQQENERLKQALNSIKNFESCNSFIRDYIDSSLKGE